eukprot:COSAG05_NODE_24747_length_222_cov_4.617886_1_plen_66_part_10
MIIHVRLQSYDFPHARTSMQACIAPRTGFNRISHFSKKLDLLTLGFVTDIQFVDTWANFYSHAPYI